MINEYENFLRGIILEFLGDEITSYKVSEERTKKWFDKKEVETKKNNGLCYENRLIFYSDFYDLKTIISKNWEIFSSVFIEKKRFDVFFDEIENYRNTVMHGRSLIKSQELILEGVLMDLKTLKTIYHNRNEMKEDYFIRITKVSDNIGNIWPEAEQLNKPVLRVGDEYELLIDAIDPKGREILYEISFHNSKLNIIQKENRFNFTIQKDSIGNTESIIIQVRTPDSEYKNRDIESIDLCVLPKE